MIMTGVISLEEVKNEICKPLLKDGFVQVDLNVGLDLIWSHKE